jgi:hypothetical protein
MVNLNAALAKAGLITMSEIPKQHVTAWKAFAWTAGGSAAVILHDSEDKVTNGQVQKILGELANDLSNGIDQVLTHDQVVAIGSTPQAAFLVDWKSGYYAGDGLTTPLVQNSPLGGTHGYLASHPELHSSFFIMGRRSPMERVWERSTCDKLLLPWPWRCK